jgi:hypothetical protein
MFRQCGLYRAVFLSVSPGDDQHENPRERKDFSDRHMTLNNAEGRQGDAPMIFYRIRKFLNKLYLTPAIYNL